MTVLGGSDAPVQDPVCRPVILPVPPSRKRDTGAGKVVGLPVVGGCDNLNAVPRLVVGLKKCQRRIPKAFMLSTRSVDGVPARDRREGLPEDHCTNERRRSPPRLKASRGERNQQQRRSHHKHESTDGAAQGSCYGKRERGDEGVGGEEALERRKSPNAEGQRDPCDAKERNRHRVLWIERVLAALVGEGPQENELGAQDNDEATRHPPETAVTEPLTIRCCPADQGHRRECERQRVSESGQGDESDREERTPRLECSHCHQRERQPQREGISARRHSQWDEHNECEARPFGKRGPLTSEDMRERPRGESNGCDDNNSARQ